MANNNLQAEIQSRIEAFVNDLSNLVKIAALESVAQALGGDAGAAPKRRGPGRPRGSAKRAAGAPSANGRRKRGKRSSSDVDATSQKVLSHVRAHPGQRIDEIGSALGASSKELRLPVQKLIGAKSLRTTGQRRGTRYFAGGGRGAAKAARGSRRGKRRAKKA